MPVHELCNCVKKRAIHVVYFSLFYLEKLKKKNCCWLMMQQDSVFSHLPWSFQQFIWQALKQAIAVSQRHWLVDVLLNETKSKRIEMKLWSFYDWQRVLFIDFFPSVFLCLFFKEGLVGGGGFKTNTGSHKHTSTCMHAKHTNQEEES